MESAPYDLDVLAACRLLASLEYQPEVGSTNDWALQLAQDDDRFWPLLVLTGKQTGGRGRGLNSWWSASGAITFSLVVDAATSKLPADRWPQVALVAGLAVCQSLHALYPPGIFGLKWPNDVYLNDRKLCGILVETSSSTRGRIVIGVGVNVNNSFADAPAELQSRAISLSDAAGGTFDLTETLAAIVESILERLGSLHASGDLADEFSRYCLLTGRTVEIQSGHEHLLGRCLGLDDQGNLLLHTTAGKRKVSSGTVLAWE